MHPNVDKRSFIRAKQNQIHQEREQRKHRMEGLRYEIVLHEALLKRISGLVSALRSRASEASTRGAGEVAFQAVMESSGDPKDDAVPPVPEGLTADPKQPKTYSGMMVGLLDEVNKAVDAKTPDDRYTAMLAEIETHESKVKTLIKESSAELTKMEQEEGRKITSSSFHTGFDSSQVNKSKPSGGESTQVELLNPNHGASSSGDTSAQGGESAEKSEGKDEEEEIEASPAAKKFAEIQPSYYSESFEFLSKNPQILTEKETDGLLALAFDAALESKEELSRQCVHQALLLQYCRQLGKDGVALFFKRVTTKGHRAQELFYNDVRDTFMRIRTRTREIISERAKDGGEGVEQIQLHAVEPGTVINIQVPPADSEDAEVQEARKVFEGFSPEMKKALESGELDQVNKVLGELSVEDAEEYVNLFGEVSFDERKLVGLAADARYRQIFLVWKRRLSTPRQRPASNKSRSWRSALLLKQRQRDNTGTRSN